MPSRETPATAFLTRKAISFSPREYELGIEEGTYGESVAAAMGVPPEQMFKTLVAEVDGRFVVAIVPVGCQLSLKRLARAAGGKRARMADSGEAERRTGFVRGGISPFGQRQRHRTYVDASALDHKTVWVSGGRRGLQVEVAPVDLVRVVVAGVVSGLGS